MRRDLLLFADGITALAAGRDDDDEATPAAALIAETIVYANKWLKDHFKKE